MRDNTLDDQNDQQTIIVNAETGERHHPKFAKLFDLSDDDPDTILKVFQRGKELATDTGNFCGSPVLDEQGNVQSYSWKTYGQVEAAAKKCALFLQEVGLEPGTDIVGIFAKNCLEYFVAILACCYRNLPNCSLYDTLGHDAVKHVCNETEMKLIFVEDVMKLKTLYSIDTKHITTVVLLKANEDIPSKEGITVISWDAAMEHQSRNKLEICAPRGDDLATINYTSGTSGTPKGVMLTHHASTVCALSVATVMPVEVTVDDVWFSYLPLAHVFERFAHILWMSAGAKCAFSSGNILKITDELAMARPTIFGAVPRTLNKLYEKVNQALDQPGCVNGIKASLVRKAMASKRGYLNEGIVTKNTLWDSLVLAPIQQRLGGRVHSVMVGAAPIEPKVKGFIRETLSAHVVEGYGQTETFGGITGTFFSNYHVDDGAVGTPLPCGAIKLVDVKDMNYLAKNNQGEICYRGHNMLKGYFKNEAKTKEAIDDDGWLHTGDIGEWTKNGALRIIDRKKHIFKMQQGEYIAPERLESIYEKSPFIDQVFVYGNSLQAYLVALLVIDKNKFKASFYNDTEQFMSHLSDFAKRENLKGFEKIKKFIMAEPFTVENELITPTLKKRRALIQKQYQEQLEELYEQ